MSGSLPPSLLSLLPASRPAGIPQSSSRKKSPRLPKQAKSTRAPALTAGAPHHGESLVGLPSVNLDRLSPLRVLLSQTWPPTPPHPVREPRYLFLAPRHPALLTFSLSL